MLIGSLSYIACKSTENVNLPHEEGIIKMLKNNLNDKMNAVYEQDPNVSKDTSDFEVRYFSIINKKDLTGVYIYSRGGTHSSNKNFFTYDKSGAHIINTRDVNTALAEIKSFLIDQKFTDIEQKQCLEKITRVLTDNTTDSF
jgi:hypothetical protein